MRLPNRIMVGAAALFVALTGACGDDDGGEEATGTETATAGA